MKPLFSSPTGGATMGPVPGSEFHNDRINHLHGGIDLNCPMGHVLIAPRAGFVVFAGASSGLGGNKVALDHGVLRDGKRHYTAHYHFGPKFSWWEDVIVVREGQHVRRGDPLGNAGMSGNATAPHDHYEHLVDGRQIDPLQYLREYQVVRRPLRRLSLALAYAEAVGPDIPFLQERLIAHGLNPGPVDGVFGELTLGAVLTFQAGQGLTVDGIVGRNTWTALVLA
jgi:hypothetical protein